MIELSDYIDPDRYSRRFMESGSRLESARRFEEPDRVPVILSTNYRFSERFHDISMREYFLEPRKQILGNLLHARFMLENFDHDVPGYSMMAPSFHNTVEASAMGCEVFFPEHDVAMARTPLLDDIRDVDRLEVPDPRRDGLMARCFEYYEVFKRELGTQLDVRVGGSCDGIFTLATQVASPRQIIRAMHDDPSLVRDLMEICLETEIVWTRERLEEEGRTQEVPRSWNLADDSCQLLSPGMYENFVAPYQRKLLNTFSRGGLGGIHLCGHVAHLIPSIKRLFNPRQWDFGYPIDPLWAKETVGDDCVLMGNISPLLLAGGTVDEVVLATRRCLEALSCGAGYILMDGSNIPGDAPLENVRALVDSAHRYGSYPRG